MSALCAHFKAARVRQRRYGHKFSGPKFKPKYRSPRRRRMPKPKWMK